MNKPKILFTSVVLPYEKLPVRDDTTDFFVYRNTSYQKVFQLKQMLSHHPLHLIAQNQPYFAVVIENPTWEQFTKEIMTGEYDVVAITFTVPLAGKILKMVRWIKESYPKIEIILGGYGAAIFNYNLGIENEIRKYVDRICFGEGIAFFRSYLRERWGAYDIENYPLKQELIENKNYLFRSRLKLFEAIPFVKSVGCNNGCIFCTTSAYFKKRKFSLFSYEELYKLIITRIQKNTKASGIMIYDEDYLENKEGVLKFSELIKQNEVLNKRPVYLSVFTSLMTLNNYSVDELLKAGIYVIFIGIESCYNEIIAEENLFKRKIENLKSKIESLHNAGINTYCSIIIGWDGHTKENILDDVNMFVDLNPTLYQVVPLLAAPGTALWDKFLRGNRLSEYYQYTNYRLPRSYKYKNFSSEQIQDYVFMTLKNLVIDGGPWPYRFFCNIYSGYNYLQDKEDTILKWRRQGYFRLLKKFLPFVYMSYFLFLGKNFRKKIKMTLGQFRKQFPLVSFIGLVQACVFIIPLHLIYLYGLIKYKLSRYPDQPDYIRKEYNY